MIINKTLSKAANLSLAGVFLLMLFSLLAFEYGMSETGKLAIIEGGNLHYYLWSWAIQL